ncbi:MAG: CBS domain-containing protein [Steroidobacteraceae bacterium]
MALVKHLLDQKGRVTHTIAHDASVLDAIRRMAELGIGALVVMRDTQAAGIVSERDYARKVILQGRSSRDTKVTEIMSAPIIAVDEQTTVDRCMRLMTQHRIRHLPVLDDRELLGVVSIGDLVKALIAEQRETIEQLQAYIHQ